MAEIHVQQKKQSSNLTWVWILVALLVIGALVYYLVYRNQQTQRNTAPADAASQLDPQSRPEKPQREKVFIPVVYMRSV
jgi:uncharacterized membrane protein YebE (DUF533 family)